MAFSIDCLFAHISEVEMFPLMIWRDWTMCPDLEAHGATTVTGPHLSSQKLQHTPETTSLCGPEWMPVQMGHLSPGSAPASCGTLDQSPTLSLSASV